jgi:hypothetical protein
LRFLRTRLNNTQPLKNIRINTPQSLSKLLLLLTSIREPPLHGKASISCFLPSNGHSKSGVALNKGITVIFLYTNYWHWRPPVVSV